MNGNGKESPRELSVAEDPRFELARALLKTERPEDWLGVLTMVVNGLNRFRETKDESLWDEMNETPGLEVYLTTTRDELLLDVHKEKQSIISFLRNKLTTQADREEEASKPTLYDQEWPE